MSLIAGRGCRWPPRRDSVSPCAPLSGGRDTHDGHENSPILVFFSNLLVMDWDLDFANDEAVFGGRGARQYAFGAPILWSPFFILGHVWLSALNLLGGDLRVDGYYFPYQRAVGLGTLLYGFVGLVLIYRVLRRYFSKGLACCRRWVVRHLVPDLVSHRRQFDGARRLNVRDHAVPLPLAPIPGRPDTGALGLAWCRRGRYGHGAVAEQRVRGASPG